MMAASVIGVADTREDVPVALQDDVARLVAVMVRQHQDGKAEQLRYQAFGLQPGTDSVGMVAKACGVSKSVVQAWEHGHAMPTVQEGLAWLAFLYSCQPPPFAAQVLARQAEDVAARP